MQSAGVCTDREILVTTLIYLSINLRLPTSISMMMATTKMASPPQLWITTLPMFQNRQYLGGHPHYANRPCSNAMGRRRPLGAEDRLLWPLLPSKQQICPQKYPLLHGVSTIDPGSPWISLCHLPHRARSHQTALYLTLRPKASHNLPTNHIRYRELSPHLLQARAYRMSRRLISRPILENNHGQS